MKDKVKNIIADLENTKDPLQDIARRHGVSASYVSKINHGVNSKEEGREYPIRGKSEQMPLLNLPKGKGKVAVIWLSEEGEPLVEFPSIRSLTDELGITYTQFQKSALYGELVEGVGYFVREEDPRFEKFRDEVK